MITGIIPMESSIFKSALHPLRLTFKTRDGGSGFSRRGMILGKISWYEDPTFSLALFLLHCLVMNLFCQL
jgi:hypothetical protein